jgi:hypothetical protein
MVVRVLYILPRVLFKCLKRQQWKGGLSHRFATNNFRLVSFRRSVYRQTGPEVRPNK